MAILQNIRNRSTLLLIVLGAALVGFIVSEFVDKLSTQGGVSMFNNYILKVGDQTITPAEFEQMVDKNRSLRDDSSEEASYAIRQETWDNTLRTLVMNEQYEVLGITVSNAEVMDMYQGEFVSPLVQQGLANPQTGQADKQYVTQVLNMINADPQVVASQANRQQFEEWARNRSYILSLEEAMIEERKQSKFTSLLQKAMITNSVEEQMTQIEQSTQLDFEYVPYTFSSIPDSSIQVSAQEISSYYKKHIENYTQEESRGIKYVVFSIIPSTEDHRKAKEEIMALREEFAKTSDDVAFINTNSNIPFNQYSQFNKSKEEVEEKYRDWAFSAKVGDMFEPQFSNNVWEIVKLHEINEIPDSVRLLVLQLDINENRPYEQTIALSDSLYRLAKGGANFVELMKNYPSPNNSSETEGVWVQEGNVTDSCFLEPVGGVFKMLTQQGVVLLKVVEHTPIKKKVKLAKLSKEVFFSPETEDRTYINASEFHAKLQKQDFDTLVEQSSLFPLECTLQRFDYNIPSAGANRDLVRWAFDSELNSCSDLIQIDNKIIVAQLVKINDGAYAPLQNVAANIKMNLIKKKKAEYASQAITKALKENQSLEHLAKSLNTTIDRSSASFSNTALGSNNEPSIIAALSTTKNTEKILFPLVGSHGVYAVKIKDAIQMQVSGSQLAQIQQRKMQEKMIRQYMLNQSIFETLRKQSDIKDQRYKLRM